jgi:hypothetical protein
MIRELSVGELADNRKPHGRVCITKFRAQNPCQVGIKIPNTKWLQKRCFGIQARKPFSGVRG